MYGVIIKSKSSMDTYRNAGRPFGGTMWLYKENLKKSVEVEFVNFRISLIKIQLIGYSIMLIGIYTSSSTAAKSLYKDELSELFFLYKKFHKSFKIILIGDFNADIRRSFRFQDNLSRRSTISMKVNDAIKSRRYPNDLQFMKFLKKNNLIALNHLYMQKTNFTFISNKESTSFIDHIVSHKDPDWSEIDQINVLNTNHNVLLPVNLSDHHPIQLLFKISIHECSNINNIVKKIEFNKVVHKLNWTPTTIQKYQLELVKALEESSLLFLLNQMEENCSESNCELVIQSLYDCFKRCEICLSKGQNNVNGKSTNSHNKLNKCWNEELQMLSKIKRFHSKMALKYQDLNEKYIQ